MVSVRVMPCLLLQGPELVKTVQFRDPKYLGDPRNAVRIFNEKEVDELVLLDIAATPEHRSLQFDLVKEIVSEAFMPVAYGGGIRTVEEAQRFLSLGVEKVIINTAAVENPNLVRECGQRFGAQSVVVCLDVKRSLLGKYECFTHSGKKGTKRNPAELAAEMEKAGAGEIVVNSIDRDGQQKGYDTALIQQVCRAVRVPVVACGGAGRVEDFAEAASAGASAVAAGSLFVFHGRHRAVLISYPAQSELEAVLGRR